MKNATENSFIHIRIVSLADSTCIWNWRNDATTRLYSFNSQFISWQTHRQWYAKALRDPDRIIYVGLSDTGGKIGMCRFDLAPDHRVAEISINLNPAFRGRRLSSPMVAASIRQFRTVSNAALIATIKNDNLASLRCFARSGFELETTGADFSTFRLGQPGNKAV